MKMDLLLVLERVTYSKILSDLNSQGHKLIKMGQNVAAYRVNLHSIF
jgi:hypothetical protein